LASTNFINKFNDILKNMEENINNPKLDDLVSKIDTLTEIVTVLTDTVANGFTQINKRLDQKADKADIDFLAVEIGKLWKRFDEVDRKIEDKFNTLWLQQRYMDIKLRALLDKNEDNIRQFKENRETMQLHEDQLMRHDVRLSILETRSNKFHK